MYVCICNAVTDRDIRRAVDAGATTLKALCRELDFKIACPTCAECVRGHLTEALSRRSGPEPATIRDMAPVGRAVPVPA